MLQNVTRPLPIAKIVFFVVNCVVIYWLASLFIFGWSIHKDQKKHDPAWTNANVSAFEDNGNRVVEELAAYRKQHGTFPVKLDDLRADGNVVPKPAAPLNDWGYQKSGDDFRLEFHSPNNLNSRSITSKSNWDGDLPEDLF